MGDEKTRPKHKTERPLLSAREIRFAQLLFEYGKRNQTKAYLEAGYEPRFTTNATEVDACRVARKPHVREYLRELQKHASDVAKSTIEEMISGVRAIAKSDRRTLFDKRGVLLPPDQIPDDVADAIESVESEEIYEPVPGQKGKKRLKGHMRKIKTGSRLAAWRLLAELRQFIGADKTNEGKAHDPLVVAGKANPEEL